MSPDSDIFERTVWRIHRLLVPEGVEVTWNERIPDPDTPAQRRQVDVIIRRLDYLFIVECRDHAAKQDVKWIEELCGRRESLNANGIGAASTSGYTAPAMAKAARFGIPLFDLTSISDAEISAWGRRVVIHLHAYKFENFRIRLEFSKQDLGAIETTRIPIELADYSGLRSLFSPASKVLDGKDLLNNPERTFKFGVRFYIPGFTLQGSPVVQIETTGTASLETIRLEIPETSIYSYIGRMEERAHVFVQQFDLGETQVIHKDGKLAVTLDIGALKLPPYWQFRYCQIVGDYLYDMELFEILNPERMIMDVDRLDIEVAATEE